MAKVASNPEVDPTLPKVSITIEGKEYFLCFTFGALALAESKLRAAGVPCNLLRSLDLGDLDATKMIPLLFAALITYEPDITFERVAAMFAMRNVGIILDGIVEAYSASMADSDGDSIENPQKPE